MIIKNRCPRYVTGFLNQLIYYKQTLGQSASGYCKKSTRKYRFYVSSCRGYVLLRLCRRYHDLWGHTKASFRCSIIIDLYLGIRDPTIRHALFMLEGRPFIEIVRHKM